MNKIKQAFSKNPYVSLMRISWKYAATERYRYLLIYLMFTASNILSALEPVIWGLFINEIQKQGTNIIYSGWIYVGAFMLIRLLDWVFHGNARVMERLLAFNMSQNFLQELYHKTVHLPTKWHQDNHSGASINRIRKAYEALRDFFQNGFRYIHAIYKFVFAFAAILYFSPLFGGVALLIGIGIIYVISKFDKPFVVALKETNERDHQVSSTLFDSLSNIVTVITLRLEQRMEESILQKVKAVYPPFKRKAVVNEWKWFVVDMLVGLIYAVVIIGYLYQNYVPGQVFMIGGLIMLAGYVNNFASVFTDFAWLYTEVVRLHTDVNTAENINQAYQEHYKGANNEKFKKNWQSITISQLYFSHEALTEQKKIQGLQGVDLHIERGKKIALIGESGSGKSTLLKILRGLYLPDQAPEVMIDQTIRQNHLALVNNQVALFPQEPEIFENTIEYNITLGLPFEPAEIEAACRTAHFTEVIEQLPKGLQSNIQEKGVNLSGGQKQRLALARGVFVAKFSDIILLDEPTSSVDPKTEMKIYDEMFAQFADKVVISALHRLHLLPKFDYIYVMKDGKVVDEGTFAYLRYQSSVFQELWKHQEEVLAVG